MLGKLVNSRTLVLVSSLFAGNALANNSSGTILFPLEGETKTGNLLLVVSQASDPEGVQRVDMRFTDSISTINVCNNNCNTSLRRPIVGINPLDFGQQRGALQMELVVTDTQGTEQVVDNVNFNWQPPIVDNVSATRQPGTINVAWDNVTGASRYNLYLASESGITPSNINTKANAQVFRSISATSQQVSGFSDNLSAFALVTAVDRSGESAFSEELIIPAINNELPQAVEDSFTTLEDTSVQGNVLSNDSDAEEEELTATLLTSTENGTLTFLSDGSFTYQPSANFNGNDSFTYQVTDEANGIAQADVVITVTPVNDVPTANNDQYTLNEDTVLTVDVASGLLSNDTDVEQPSILSVSLVSNTNSGSLSLNSDGSFIYQPSLNFFGQDQFTYQVEDDGNATSTATVSLVVSNINDAPLAINDTFQTIEDGTLESQSSVLDNDSDPDFSQGSTQQLTASLISDVSNGSLVLNENGFFTYRPNSQFNGIDSFTYQVSDNAGASSQASVNITITSVNDAPIARDDFYTVNEDTRLTISSQEGVLSNDTDPDFNDSLTASLINSPSKGTITFNTNGSFTYIPKENEFGLDNFTYIVTDEEGLQSSANVQITIIGVEDKPVANDDEVSTGLNQTITIDVLSNDYDPDGNNISVSSVSSSSGEAETNGTTIIFTPNNNFYGVAVIDYTITNDNELSDSGQVLVSVAIDIEIIANNDIMILDEDTTTTIDAVQNDVGTGILTLESASAQNGQVVITENNSLSYTPNNNYNGQDAIIYTISDSANSSANGQVSLTINPVNDIPVANTDLISTEINTSVTIDVLANDTDIDGDELSIITATTSNGTVSILSNKLLLTPNPNYLGNVSVEYSISDNNGGSSSSTVSVEVKQTAILANNDQANTLEDQSVIIDVTANDIGSGTLSVSSASANSGTVIVGNDNLLTYTPLENFNGTDSITYLITDNANASASARVDVSVTPVNDAPVANNDFENTDASTPININVLANDMDVDGDQLTIVNATVDNGSVIVESDNTITFIPLSQFIGVAEISYEIKDTSGATDNGKVTVDVSFTVLNANDDNVSVLEDKSINIDILANDEGNSGLTITSASVSVHTLVIENDNTLTFTPLTNFNGNASITYTISDNSGASDTASVEVSVVPVNDAPSARNDNITINNSSSVEIDVLANDTDVDNDTLTINSASANDGSVAITNSQTLSYTPESGFIGTTSINYTINDEKGATDSATVFIEVTSSDLLANDDSVTTQEDVSINIDVLANDTGDEGLSVNDAAVPSGSIDLENDNTITFTPEPNFSGTTSFTYFISDNSGVTDSATVTVTVTAVNDGPTAVADGYILTGSQSVTVAASEGVLINDTDIENDSFTATLVSGPSYSSSFNLNADGSFTYQHDGSNNVFDSFSYAGTNTESGNTVTVSLNIAKQNDIAKLCNLPPLHAISDQAFSFNLEANNPDNDSLSYSASNLPSWLTLTGNTLTGTPTDSDIGTVKNIALSVSDGIDSHELSNVHLTVTNNFGSSDIVDFNFGSLTGESRVTDLAIDRNGKIIAVGSVNDSGDSIAVARFNPDGTLDTSFSGDGIYTLDLSYSFDEKATGVIVDKNNNILVSAYGSEDSVNADNDFYLIKLNEDGSLDTNFSGDGLVSIDLQSDKTDQTSDLVLHSDGDISLIGFTETGSGNYDVAIVHIKADGSIDTSFGNSGQLIFNQSNDQFAQAAVLDDKGFIYIVGSHYNGSDTDVLLLRITDSNIDATFNNGTGSAFTLAESNSQTATDVIIDKNGDLLIVGSSNDNFALYNLALDSSNVPNLSTTLFSAGKVEHDIGDTDVAHQLVSDRLGKFFAVGISGTTTPRTSVIKLNEDGSLDTSFATSGVFIESTGSGNAGNTSGATLTASGQLITAGPQSDDTRLRVHQINSNNSWSCNYTSISTNTTQTVDSLSAATKAPNGQMFFAGQSTNPSDGQLDFIVFKTSPDLALDSNFADNGVLRHDYGSTTRGLTLTHVLADTNNSPYLIGYARTDDLYIAKYTNDGLLDSNFSNAGVNNFGGGDVSLVPTQVSIDSSDNLYIMGTSSANKATVMKFTSTGGSDLGFANGSDIEYSDTDFTANDIEVLSDGSIMLIGKYSAVIAESSRNFNGFGFSLSAVSNRLAILKYTSAGVLDTSFGTSGFLQINTSYESVGLSATVNGSYIYILTQKSTNEAQVRKIDSSGNEVTSFGTNGVLDLTGYFTYSGAQIQYSSSTGHLYVQVQNADAENVLISLEASSGALTPEFINAGVATYTHNLANWDAIEGFIQSDNDDFVIFGTEANDMALSLMFPDGRISNEDSELLVDAGFGYFANSLTLDHSSRVLIAGSSYSSSNNSNDATYARFNFDGTADTSLTGSSAVEITADVSNFNESYRDIIVSTSNEIQVTGQSFSSSSAQDNNIIGLRTQPDSVTVDSNYASGGFDLDLASISDDKINDQLLLSDGSLIMVGSLNDNALVTKLDIDGALDTNFDSDGFRELSLGDSSALYGVSLDSDGKLIVVGEKTSSGNTSAVILKLDTVTGAYDTSFDTDGIAVLDESSFDSFSSVAVTTNGNYVAVGTSDDQTLIAQFNTDGTAYTNFNSTGFITTDLGDNDIASAVTVDNFGAILVATQTADSAVLLRYDDSGTELLLSEYFPRGNFIKINDMSLDHLGNAYLTGHLQVDQVWEFFVIKFDQVASPQ